MRRLMWTVGIIIALAIPSGAEELPDWIMDTKISGYMFGDAYWLADYHDADLEGKDGFWYRRIYLTLDHTLSSNLELRLRFEMSSPGDFSTSGKLEPSVKDAYVKWKRSRQDLYLGISPTPTWSAVEKFWGYRAVEKTALDLQKMGSSRDFGVALKGSFDSGRKFRYHAMIGNGSGTKSETNEEKKVMLALGFYPSEAFFLEVYGDFDDRPSRADRRTYQIFAGYRGGRGRLGFQVARQHREVPNGDALELDLASIFGVFKASERISLFVRYDRMFDPNPDGDRIPYIPFDPTARSNLVVAGLDFTLHKRFDLIPNVEAVFYDSVDGGSAPHTDIIPRLTLFVRF